MENMLHPMNLNEIEDFLKKIYHSSPNRHLARPTDYEKVKDIFDTAYAANNLASSDSLSEMKFIPDDMDCAFIRHLRYMPAYLHQHEFFELLYVINGSCENSFSDRTFLMQPGDICISAPSSVHAVSAFSDDDVMFNILLRHSTFEHAFLGLLDEDDILATFFKRALYHTNEIPYLLFHTGSDEELLSIFERAHAEYYSRHRFRRQMTNSLLSEFFISMLRSHEQHVEAAILGKSKNSENIIFILKYIQEHVTSISLKDLSEFFNYSERHLQRLIEAATGKSFTDLVQEQKMKLASSLLARSSLPIELVCEQSGYASANNFRRIFAKYYGCTPREYRKRHAKISS